MTRDSEPAATSGATAVSGGPTALVPSVVRTLPRAVAAEGARIVDENGKDYVDASSGPLAVSLGHGHPRIATALAEQLATVDYVHRTQFRTDVVEEYATAVTGCLGHGLDHVMMVSSGSEANELAMKFAHMYWAAQRRPTKSRLVSTDLSYHGNTVGALSASGQPRYAIAYRPLLNDVEHIRAPKAFRLHVPEGTTAAEMLVSRLRQDFARLDLEHTAAIILESIGGSGSGVTVPPPAFLEELRGLCDEHDLLWIADEVMSGFGRTGAWFGFQHSSAVPDIVTFAKGAGGGVIPLGGAALSAKVWSQIHGTYPAMPGGHTFTNSPAACAVGLAVVDVIESEGLLARVTDRGAALGEQLRELQRDLPFVGDVRGCGYMWALELVADPETLAPPEPALDLTARMVAAGVEHGVLLYPARACHDGVSGDAVMVAPPLTTTDAEMDELVRRLRAALSSLRPFLSRATTAGTDRQEKGRP